MVRREPDLRGLAALRYALHTELSTFSDRIGLDRTFFADRTSSNVLAPTDLDFTAELSFHAQPIEVHLASERDMPLCDRALGSA